MRSLGSYLVTQGKMLTVVYFEMQMKILFQTNNDRLHQCNVFHSLHASFTLGLPSISSSMNQVICVCEKCMKSTVVIDGQEMPGRLVSAQTRRNHERSDKGPTPSSSTRGQQSRSDRTVHGHKVKSKGEDIVRTSNLSKLTRHFRDSPTKLLDDKCREVGMRNSRLASHKSRR